MLLTRTLWRRARSFGSRFRPVGLVTFMFALTIAMPWGQAAWMNPATVILGANQASSSTRRPKSVCRSE